MHAKALDRVRIFLILLPIAVWKRFQPLFMIAIHTVDRIFFGQLIHQRHRRIHLRLRAAYQHISCCKHCLRILISNFQKQGTVVFAIAHIMKIAQKTTENGRSVPLVRTPVRSLYRVTLNPDIWFCPFLLRYSHSHIVTYFIGCGKLFVTASYDPL